MSAKQKDQPFELKLPEQVRVGSYFLETLTTGMYEDPFHCIREYVQNAFDAIRDAREARTLPVDGGKITVTTIQKGKTLGLSIQDDGTGIPEAQAVDRLVSLGSSNKRPMQHAGFRGIGRLAGIAYCTTLRFTTSSAGEATASVIEFDCGQLRGDMRPGAAARSVSDVLKAAIKLTSKAAKTGEHYTLVEMEGLVDEGLEFLDNNGDDLLEYLQQYAPVDYGNDFSFVDKIKKHLQEQGVALPIVQIELRRGRERTSVLKAYRDVTDAGPNGREQAKLSGVFTAGVKEHGWAGWIGLSNFPGELQDDRVAGVRLRMKNIQVGNEEVVIRIMEDKSARSDRRMVRYLVGEIFIDAPNIVPNARRDGFEEGKAWRDLKTDILAIMDSFVKRIRAESTRRNSLNRVEKKVEETKDKLGQDGPMTQGDKNALDEDLRKQLTALENAVSKGADEKRAKALISAIKDIQERLQKVKIQKAAGVLTVAAAMKVVRAELSKSLAKKADAKRIGDAIEAALTKAAS